MTPKHKKEDVYLFAPVRECDRKHKQYFYLTT